MTSLADAVRGKSGVSGKLSIEAMTSAVNSIVINQGSDIDLSGVTVTADKLLAGIVAVDGSGNKVTGNIPDVSLSQDGNTVSIEAGYTAGGSITVTGGGDTPSYPNAAVSVSGNIVTITEGLIGAQQVTIPESVITETGESVTIGIGYIGEEKVYQLSSGTSGNSVVFGYVNVEGKIQPYDFETYPPSMTGEPFEAELHTLILRPADIDMVDGDYMRFTAEEPSTVSITAYQYDEFDIFYRKSSEAPWTRLENEVPVSLAAGEYMEVYGNYPGSTWVILGTALEDSVHLQFTITGKVRASGYVNSISQFRTSLESSTLGYGLLFAECSGLLSSPIIPPMGVGTSYVGNPLIMLGFSSCSSLAEITVEFTEWGNDGDTDGAKWVSGVASSGVFRKPAALPVVYGEGFIPEGWTVEITD